LGFYSNFEAVDPKPVNPRDDRLEVLPDDRGGNQADVLGKSPMDSSLSKSLSVHASTDSCEVSRAISGSVGAS
jgi:hypothetical protein